MISVDLWVPELAKRNALRANYPDSAGDSKGQMRHKSTAELALHASLIMETRLVPAGYGSVFIGQVN
jgi:hypothetical protein